MAHYTATAAAEPTDADLELGPQAMATKRKPHHGAAAATPASIAATPVRDGAPYEPYDAPLPDHQSLCGLCIDDYTTTQYISPTGVQNLKFYKYTGKDLSLIGNLFLFRVHTWLAYRLPLWLAPNVVTLCGLACNLIAFALVYAYVDPVFGGTTSDRWVYAVAGTLLLAYQALDNMDGKQARRTGSSSALGELFDHVCDASCVTIFTMLASSAGGVDPYMMFAMSWASLLLFHAAHWEEYYVGELIMGLLTGPTEAILTIAAFLYLAAIVGPENLASYDVLGTGFYLGHLAISAMVLISVTTFLFGHSKAVVQWCLAHNVPLSQPFIEMTPFALCMGSNFVWLWASIQVAGYDNNILMRAPVLFMLQAGLFVAYLETRLLTQRICRERSPVIYLVNAPSLFAAAHACAGATVGVMPFDEVRVAYSVFLVQGLFFSYLVYTLCNQLCTALNIHVFKIPFPNAGSQL